MPNLEKFKLPDGQIINCIFLERDVMSHLGWLHNIRKNKTAFVMQKTMYKFNESKFVKNFASEVIASTINYDVVISAPSRHLFSKRYKDGLILKENTLDISDRISRTGENLASTSSSYDKFKGEFKYAPEGDESKFSSVLIIDDVLGTGKTALHIIDLLKQFGVPADTTFSLAVPLWVQS